MYTDEFEGIFPSFFYLWALYIKMCACVCARTSRTINKAQWRPCYRRASSVSLVCLRSIFANLKAISRRQMKNKFSSYKNLFNFFFSRKQFLCMFVRVRVCVCVCAEVYLILFSYFCWCMACSSLLCSIGLQFCPSQHSPAHTHPLESKSLAIA